MRGGPAPEASESDTKVAELTVRLRHCQVTVRVESADPAAGAASSSGSFSVVGGESRAGVPFDAHWAYVDRHQGILDHSPADFAAWDIGVHRALARGDSWLWMDGQGSYWSSLSRWSDRGGGDSSASVP